MPINPARRILPTVAGAALIRISGGAATGAAELGTSLVSRARRWPRCCRGGRTSPCTAAFSASRRRASAERGSARRTGRSSAATLSWARSGRRSASASVAARRHAATGGGSSGRCPTGTSESGTSRSRIASSRSCRHGCVPTSRQRLRHALAKVISNRSLYSWHTLHAYGYGAWGLHSCASAWRMAPP